MRDKVRTLSEIVDQYYRENPTDKAEWYRPLSPDEIVPGFCFEAFAAMQYYPPYWFTVCVKEHLVRYWQDEVRHSPARQRIKV